VEEKRAFERKFGEAKESERQRDRSRAHRRDGRARKPKNAPFDPSLFSSASGSGRFHDSAN
jgi:hypothetical protein